MKFKDYILLAGFVSLLLIVSYYRYNQTSKNLDRQNFIRDSLSESIKRNQLIIDALKDSLKAKDSIYLQSVKRSDSLMVQQNKIHVYYDKKINSFNTVSNDSLYGALRDILR